MNNFKKILSVVVALVMIISTFSILAFATAEDATVTGVENDDKMNVKFSVEQVDLVSPNGENIGAVDNNLYAVTLSMKAVHGVMYLQVPVHWNKEHFDIIMDGNWEGNGEDGDGSDTAWLGYEGFYEENEFGSVATYTLLGQTFSDTAWYRSNGNSATSANNAVYIGNGRTQATYALQVEYVDTSRNTYEWWTTNQTVDGSSTGVAFICFDMSNNKTALLNVYDKTIITEWDDLLTIYFQRKDGVSEADVVGDVFGIYGDTNAILTGWEENGMTYKTTSCVQTKAGLNLVSNAVVTGEAEEPAYGVEFLKDQIKFNTVKATGDYAGTFNYRTIAKLTGFADADEIKANVQEAGFIFNRGSLDKDVAIAQIEAGEGDYAQAKSAYISTTAVEGEFTMACVVYNVDDADKDTELSALAYLILKDGTVVTFETVNTSTFSGLYNTYYSQAFPG